MKLEQQVVSLELAKRLVDVECSRSILITYEVLPEVQKRKATRRVLSAEGISLGEREVPRVLQRMHSQTKKRLVLQAGRTKENARTSKEAQGKQSSFIQREAQRFSLERQVSRSGSIWGKVRVLRRKGAEILGDRPHKREWERAQKNNKKSDHLRMATPQQLSVRLQGALPQLQYGSRLLEGMPS